MSEPLARLGLVLVVLLLGLLVSVLLRASAKGRPPFIRESGLQPGVYLFTSRDCADCVSARRELHGLRGESFTQVAWEESPSTFRALGVDLVPTTAIVGTDGSATVYPGVPAAALERLSP